MIKHGGHRAGAGRKPAPRDPQKKLRAVWCWTTKSEQDMINEVLTADERTLILFQCVVAKQNGNDWWNNKKRISGGNEMNIKVTVVSVNTGATDTGMFNTEDQTVIVDGQKYEVSHVDDKDYVRTVYIEHF